MNRLDARRPACWFALCAALVPTAPAAEEDEKLDVGSKAPAIETDDWLNDFDGDFSWQKLSGRLILVHRWQSWSGSYRKAVARLNEWQEKYGERGFTVVGVCDEPRLRLNEFILKHDIEFIIAAEYRGAYRSITIPYGWLVGPEGDVLWKGELQSLPESMIKVRLRALRPRFSLPKELEAAEKLLNAGSYAEGAHALRKGAEESKDAAIGTAAKETLGTIRSYGEGQLQDAKAYAAEGDYTEAILILEAVEKGFRETRIGNRARTRLEELKSDKNVRTEIEAAKKLEAAMKAVRDKRDSLAFRLLGKIVRTKKYKETRAAAKAREELEALVARRKGK